MTTEEFTPDMIIDRAARWLDRGDRKRIAEETGVGYSTVCRALAKEGLKKKRHFKVLAAAERIVKEYEAYFSKA